MKFLFTFITSVMVLANSLFAQNVIKQCTPTAFYYSCGATQAHQSQQGPWLDFVVNGNTSSWYQGYSVDYSSWKEFDNGTAKLTARLTQIIDGNVKWDLDMTFSSKTSAFVPHGGGDGWHCLPSSTADWYYYKSATGTLTGVAGSKIQGAKYNTTLVSNTALQIGTGGSINSTSKYGMSAWLSLSKVSGPNVNTKLDFKGGADLYFDLTNCTNTNTCSNFTSGGTICCDQSGCSPFDPARINSTALPSGGSGNTEYVWLKSTTASTLTTANANQWQQIAGSTADSYDPGVITQTTWFIRCARRSGCTDYTGESNIVKMTITGNCGGTCPNLVTNGSFGAGFTGFQTDIAHKNGPDCGNGGAAAVRANPNEWGFSANCPDQDGNGKQLLIDYPAGDVWQKIWGQTVTVQTNTTYTFTFWAQNIYPANPGQLYAMINAQVFPVKTLPMTTCQWVKYEVQWNSGNSTSAALLIKNNNAECHGNDFGIDNISFSCNGGGGGGTCNVGVNASNNGPKCSGQGVQLTATGNSSSTGSGVGTGGTTIYGNNLVVNSNFDAGNTGFTSELTYKVWDGGCNNYTVTSTPKSDWGWPALCSDHTGNNGKMLVLDSPSGDAWQVHWKQCIAVQPNTTYEFSYWATSLYSGNPARLYAVFNNMNAGNVTPITTISSTTCHWQKITFTWNSGTATQACIMLKNDNGDCNGNDFAVDDITLRKVSTSTPQTCTPSYTWTGPNGYTSTQQNPTVNAPGVYTVVYKDQYCCTASATTTVATSPAITLVCESRINDGAWNVESDCNVFVCSGNKLLLSVNPNVATVNWTGPNGFSAVGQNDILISNSITATQAGSYTATLTDANGCVGTATIIVGISPSPTVNITGNLSVCNNGTTSLTASGGGTYAWSNGSNTASITVGAGTYSVTVTNVAGCTATKTVTVNNTQFTTSITGNLSVCANQTTTLTATGGGSYVWSNGANTASITVGAGTYSVTVTNGACKASATATVTTSAAPIVNITGNLSVCNNGTTSLTASGGGSYVWSNGSNTASITVGAGTYTVTVTNVVGCKAVKSATVTNSNAIVTISGEPTVCQGAITTLTANGTGTYAWSNGAVSQSITVGVGTYAVTLTAANGCTATNSITVTNKNCNTSSIGDFVWCDKNANGVQEFGEPGIAGVTVTLTGTNVSGQTVNLTTTTDGSGKYNFANLQAGTYQVAFAKPTGYVSTSPDKGGNDATDSDANETTGVTATINLGAGQSNTTIDAGFYQLASIGDFVFEDKDNDGVQDAGEPGIAGVTVTLTGTAGDGTPVSLTTTTSTNGAYNFTGLKPGTYTVNFAKPNGFNPSPKDAVTGTDATDSDADTNGNVVVNLVSGQNNTTIDAGFNKPTPTNASIGDFVWCDKNANGVQDSGEPGIAGVTVTLTGTNVSGQTVNLTTTTDGSGKYNFANLQAGTYQVTFAKPTGYVSTSPDKGGNDATDSDANETTGVTASINLAAGQSNTTIDAGFYQLASIGDFVFEDKDNDGVQDAGEPGIVGVTVTLNGIVNGVPITKVTVTGANGAYSFTGLTPGSYSLTFQKPVGFNGSPANQGINDALDSDANATTGVTAPINLLSGENNATLDAGFNKPISNENIGDFVWLDCNKNGIQDSGEAGLANVTVVLKNTVTNATQTTTTNNNGIYNFANIAPGTYTITFTAVKNLTFATKDLGGNDATDSDANANGTTDVFTVNGVSINTIDAGLQDNIKPVLTGIPVDLIAECDNVPAKANATATDNCDNNVFITSYETKVNGTCEDSYILTRTWTAFDDCGNTATAVQNITVRDTKKPVLNGVPSDITIGCNTPTPAAATPTATDNCDKSVTITFAQSTAQVAGTCPKTIITREWTATDNCGNTTKSTQKICLADNEGPVISGVPADITVLCNAIPAVPTGITATDACSPSTISVMFSTTTSIAPGGGAYLVKRTWTAVDVCGNKSTKTQIICAKDTQAPTFTGVPQDVTVECNAIPPAINPTPKDNCDNKMPVTLTETRTGGSCVNNFKIKRTWTVTDDAGNKSSVTQTITVQDTTPPVISGVPADVTIQCGEEYPLPPSTITATDNCDAYVPITFSEIYYQGDCDGKSRILCQWVAKDACGNVTIKKWNIIIAGVNSRIAAPNVKGITTKQNFTVADVTVFPNPTQGNVNIQFNGEKITKVIVFDITGRMVQNVEQEFQDNLELNLNKQQKGVYTIQLHTNNGVVTKRVLLID